MVDILIAVLITGFAVSLVLELIELSFLGGFLSKQELNLYFSLPLSFGGMYLLLPLSLETIVIVPATTFVSLALSKLLTRPQIIGGSRLPRL